MWYISQSIGKPLSTGTYPYDNDYWRTLATVASLSGEFQSLRSLNTKCFGVLNAGFKVYFSREHLKA